MLKFRLQLKDVRGDTADVSVRTPDGTATSFMQTMMNAVDGLSDAQISDFDVLEESVITLPSGLKSAFEEDAHPRSNILVLLENDTGIQTRFKIPVNELPSDTDAFMSSIPSTITNLKDEVLTPVSATWSN